MRGYFVVALHWICDEWILRSCVLDFWYFPSPHNALTTCEIPKLILHEYDLQTRIRAITTDSASEMRPAMRLLCNHLNMEFDLGLTESFHIRCICHILNRAAIDADCVKEAEVSMVRELLKLFVLRSE
jgi:hypothetical protein